METEEWALFPRQREGNIYDHNWSLCEDGVVPEGDAYRNARLPILTSAVGTKAQGGKIELKSPTYTGKYAVAESGDHIPHEIFSEMFSAQQQLLSSGVNLYVEDAALGGHNQTRNGVRITSAVPAVNLIFRTLLVSGVQRDSFHTRERCYWDVFKFNSFPLVCSTSTCIYCILRLTYPPGDKNRSQHRPLK